MNPYAALLCMVVLSTMGQLLVKRGSGRLITGKGARALIGSLANGPLLAGVLSVISAPLLYMYALSKVELSIGYSFSGLTYLSIVVCGHLVLREKITLYHILGSLAILAGLTIWNIT